MTQYKWLPMEVPDGYRLIKTNKRTFEICIMPEAEAIRLASLQNNITGCVETNRVSVATEDVRVYDSGFRFWYIPEKYFEEVQQP